MKTVLRALGAGIVGALTAGVLAACATPTTGGTGPNVDANNPRAGWPSRFVLGIFGGDDADAAVDQRRPLQRHLQEQLGIPVEVIAGNSYSAVIEAMRARRADAMVVGPFAYILAAQEAGAEAIVVGVSSPIRAPQTAVFDPDLPAHYYSVIFTRKGNGINSLNDLRGRTFAFVDPASASGHLVPKTFLLNNNINPDREMRTTFAGSHPTTVLAVWGGRTDAGATTENNINRLADEGQVEYCGFPDRRIGATRTAAEVRAIF
ncbi:MAG: phosphate/phosphite/phosphonate ABC transporter substrate-binding protein, partial [Dehalococcoidia bacterium]|nr:phosphate/phosphite/phosphonate ABC transporter substrate-binding protein [Dehalococcoidia bacterium]